MRNTFTASLFVFFVYASLNAPAQTKRLDSLIAELPAAKEDTNKAKLLYHISVAYYETDPEKGIKYGEQALKHINETDDLPFLFLSDINMPNLHG